MRWAVARKAAYCRLLLVERMISSLLTDFEFAPFEIIDGDRGKNYPKQNEFSDSGYCLFLNAANVTKNGFDFSKCQFITEQKDNTLRKGKLQSDDVVLTTRGTIGNSAYFNSSIPYEHMRINSGMVILRCNSQNILPAYLYHFLQSRQFHDQVNSLRSGVAQPQLPIRDMKRIKMPLPALSIQCSIASILSTYEDLIENNRRRIQLLEQAARLLYKEWFIYFRFPGHEHTTITDGVPEGWTKRLLGDIVNVAKGKHITKDAASEGSVPVVAGGLSPAYFHDIANVTGPVITISASGANAGYVNLYYDDIWASDCSYISKVSTKYLHYLYLLLKSKQKDIFNLQKGTAQPHVYPKDLKELSLPATNNTIVSIFEESVSYNFHQIGVLLRQNRMLMRARNLLLPCLMNDEVML